MTDKPIIFSAPMVEAILSGTKTQTRRALSIKGHKGFFQFGPSDTPGHDWTFRRADHVWEDYRHDDLLRLLPIQVRDRLWVREQHYLTEDGESQCVVHTADNEAVEQHHSDIARMLAQYGLTDAWAKSHLRIRPSIHMPRWASRLTLTVTDVRVQRLQDISADDAQAEGLTSATKDGSLWKWGIPDNDGQPGTDDNGWPWRNWRADPREAFANLWNTTNGLDAWEQNPWVAAYSFDVHRCNIDQMPEAQP